VVGRCRKSVPRARFRTNVSRETFEGVKHDRLRNTMQTQQVIRPERKTSAGVVPRGRTAGADAVAGTTTEAREIPVRALGDSL